MLRLEKCVQKFLLASFAACGGEKASTVTAGDGLTESQLSSGSTSSGVSTTSGASDEGASSAGSSNTSASNGTTGDLGDECSLVLQECPAQLKCVPFSTDGVALDSTHCVPLMAQPDAPGEACKIMSGYFYNQIDTCDAGSFCWFVDGDLVNGTCVAFCSIVDGLYFCGDPATHCSPMAQEELLNLCVPKCDPLKPECPPGGLCAAGNGAFECRQLLDPAVEVYGDPCNGLWDCSAGFVCTLDKDVAACAEPCCTAYCDTGAPNSCPSAPLEECVSILGEANVEWGHVGACVVP